MKKNAIKRTNIKQMTLAYGIPRFSLYGYDTSRQLITEEIVNILKDAVVYLKYDKRKTLKKKDIQRAIKRVFFMINI